MREARKKRGTRDVRDTIWTRGREVSSPCLEYFEKCLISEAA